MITFNEKRYRYLNQRKDYKTYVDFEKQIYADYLKLSPEEKKIYYGSYDGSDNDPNIFRRYHVSYLAWTLGEPGFVMLQVHGGGYSGYVTGNTYVNTDCQFHATTSSEEDWAQFLTATTPTAAASTSVR